MDMSQLAGLGRPTEGVPEKLEQAIKEKDEGNKFFKAGDLAKAGYHYHRALLNVNGMVGISQDQQSKVNEIKVAVNNNLAAVNLKQGKLTRVVSCSTAVLQIEPNNAKALFRRGKAHCMIGALDKAADDLNKARTLDPNDKAILQELAVLKQKDKQQDKKAQRVFSNMFKSDDSEEMTTETTTETTTEETQNK